MSPNIASLACLVLLALGAVSAQNAAQLETARLVQRDQRREFITANAETSFKFRFATAVGAARVSNAAALQLQVDKSANVFLSTLSAPGSAQFLTALKPCGIILPHVHQRATEFYSILSGVMGAGIAQENGGLQNITFDVNPGEVFVVPQGLLHFNHNNQCEPNVFFQTFNNADPGALNVIGALASLNGNANGGSAAIKASNAGGVTASPQGAFALDQDCLNRCRLPLTGAPGDGLTGLSTELRLLFGLDGSAAPPSPAAAGGGSPPAGTPPAPTQAPATPATPPASAYVVDGPQGPCACTLGPAGSYDPRMQNPTLAQALIALGPNKCPQGPNGNIGVGNTGGSGNTGCYNTGTANTGDRNMGTANTGANNNGNANTGFCLTGNSLSGQPSTSTSGCATTTSG